MTKLLRLLVYVSLITLLCIAGICDGNAQTNRVNAVVYDGILVAGYVNDGAFLNFAGPGIKVKHQQSEVMLGMLPSLRFKEDTGSFKNSFVTPSLAVGLTYLYKSFAIQVPLYYNGKTATSDGKWFLGAGIGLKLRALSKLK